MIRLYDAPYLHSYELLGWPVQTVWRALPARPLDGDVEGRARPDITPQEREPFTLSPRGTANITDAPLHMFGRPMLYTLSPNT